MDNQAFEELRGHIQTYAQERGVEAELTKDDMLGSDVEPAGTRIHLYVFKRIEGQETREHPHNVAGYRPDVPDLKARLEKEVRDAAIALNKA